MSRDAAAPAPQLSAKGLKVAIACSRFNADITDRLLSGAEETLRELGAGPVTVVRVPGAFELPAAARVLIEQGHDAVVALGAVVRGDTPHFDYVCNTASLALSQLSVAHRVGIGFGLVTTNTREQALARAGGAVGHYGVSAAFAAVEMALLHRSAHRSHA